MWNVIWLQYMLCSTISISIRIYFSVLHQYLIWLKWFALFNISIWVRQKTGAKWQSMWYGLVVSILRQTGSQWYKSQYFTYINKVTGDFHSIILAYLTSKGFWIKLTILVCIASGVLLWCYVKEKMFEWCYFYFSLTICWDTCCSLSWWVKRC